MFLAPVWLLLSSWYMARCFLTVFLRLIRTPNSIRGGSSMAWVTFTFASIISRAILISATWRVLAFNLHWVYFFNWRGWSFRGSLYFLRLLCHYLLLLLLLLLLLSDLMLSDSLNKFVRVCHNLWNEMVLIVVLEVVYFLKILIVLSRNVFNICNQVLILQIQPPVLSVIVRLHPWKLGCLLYLLELNDTMLRLLKL